MDAWQRARARVAALSRFRSEDDPELAEARLQLDVAAAEKRQGRGEAAQGDRVQALLAYISHELHRRPYLTEDQLGQLAAVIEEAPRAP